ncbi:(d)CMP kinase [Alkalicoccobacillus murimartini]|uniref:Cytidylate kinase n=1 Tax=Alkalicoccobacillus murimartini TaxID=171685 RepID=A0ABT9YDV0_9BACI|nr:(d)CMP kinase [Alkalicoccobacillus murimartini]MDQ0205899.1 cytidylate kinase [Alkalicoccobacillus murimartini]
MSDSVNIAIDGPAGAGKSTVAKLVSEELGFLYIDTGAMYRALTLAAIRENVNTLNERDLSELLSQCRIQLLVDQNGSRVLLNDKDVTTDIRSDEVNKAVSLVSSYQSVREEMVERQRQLASITNSVLDGRDIGTFVLPNARLKVFLTATVTERARRRHEEQLSKGMPSDYEQLQADIAKRDELDSTRAFAPLKKAEDAVEIDTTTLSIAEVAQAITDLAKERTL